MSVFSKWQKLTVSNQKNLLWIELENFLTNELGEENSQAVISHFVDTLKERIDKVKIQDQHWKETVKTERKNERKKKFVNFLKLLSIILWFIFFNS